MNYMIRVFIILCVFLSFRFPACAADSVKSNGETLLVKAFGKFKVQIRIRTHEIIIGKPSDKRPDKTESSCTYSRYPCSMVDSLEISVNGAPLFVPRSSFCSFSDLNFIELELIREELVLVLKGGDASESYVGRIVFDQDRIIRKNVSSALAPNSILEETRYMKQVETLD
jgi:hypothetical protein